jgi:hypothetical protein
MNHAAGGLRMNRAKRDTTSYLRILYLSRSVLQFTLRVKFWMYNNLVISVNSVRLVYIENNQRRSPEQKHFGVNLLVRRLVGRSAGP